MTLESRLKQLEARAANPKGDPRQAAMGEARRGKYRQFRPQTAAELEAEKDKSRSIYSHLRAIVTSDDLPAILQDKTDETGQFLVRRFGSSDPATVRADCIELLDYLEARLCQ